MLDAGSLVALKMRRKELGDGCIAAQVSARTVWRKRAESARRTCGRILCAVLVMLLLLLLLLLSLLLLLELSLPLSGE